MIPSPPAHVQQVQSVDHLRLFACIIQLEGHAWSDEGGALAFRVAAWSEVTALPYRYAKLSHHAFNVGRLLLAKYERQLPLHGIPVSPESLGTAWRHGLTGAIRRGGRSDYGERAGNLYAAP